MKNETNFYDILNSKFNERELPYEEENWKAMRQMIEASRAAKRRAMWLVAASIGTLLCVGGGIALYNLNNNNGKTNTVTNGSSVNSNMATTNASNTATGSTNKTTAANTSPDASVNNKTVATTNNNTSPSGISTSAAGANNKPANNAPIVAANVNTSLPKHKGSVKQNRHITSSASQSLASSNNIAAANGNPATKATENKHEDLHTSKEVGSANTPAVAGSTSKSVPAAGSVKSTKTIAAATKTTGIRKTDSTAIDALPDRFSDEPRIFKGKTNIFTVDAGTEYSGGWQLGSTVQGQGFNPIIGLGYAHYMGSRIFLKTGVQFSSFGHMSTYTYSYQHSLGNVIYDSVITTKRLYFVRIPIQAEYFFGRSKRISAGAGGAVWFLVGNSGYATTSEQLDNNPPFNVVQYSQNASLDGYSKVDVSSYVLLRYTLSHKFSIYGMIYMEMTGMKSQSFFGDNIVERTHGFQFTLSYNLN